MTLQGLMFGYATDETEECMPLTIILAHKLNQKLAEMRRDGSLPWLRPDSKTQVGVCRRAPAKGLRQLLLQFERSSLQVTVEYKQVGGTVVPLRVHTIVVSVQHDETVSLEEMRRSLKEQVVRAVVPGRYLDDKTIYHLQPSGRFVIGGPQVGKDAAVMKSSSAFIGQSLILFVCF